MMKYCAENLKLIWFFLASFWFFNYCAPTSSTSTTVPLSLRPNTLSASYQNRLTRPASHLKKVGLETGQSGYLQFPIAAWGENDWYALSIGGSSVAELIHYDESGDIITRYGKKGYGPGELTQPVFMNVHGDEIFLGEIGRPEIHLMDRQLNYRKKMTLSRAGSICFTTEKWFGFWALHVQGKAGRQGHMLAILDRETGETVKNLVPFKERMYAVPLAGNGFLDGNMIYAVSANTGCLDRVSTLTWETDRIRLEHSGRNLKPLPWEKWRPRNKEIARAHAIETWLESFTRPIDLTKVGDLLFILYAEGKRYFYDVHDLEGALVSKNHAVPIPFPRFQGRRIVGILSDQEDQQYFAYIELGPDTEIDLGEVLVEEKHTDSDGLL